MSYSSMDSGAETPPSTDAMSCGSDRRLSDVSMRSINQVPEPLLPSELIISILAFADIATTATCEQVCYTWYFWSRRQHETAIWKPKLIRKILGSLGYTAHTSGSIKSGSASSSSLSSLSSDWLIRQHQTDSFAYQQKDGGERTLKYIWKQIQPRIGGSESWRDLVFIYQVWSDCLPFSRPHGMTLRSGRLRPAHQYLNPDTPSLVQPLSSLQFQVLAIEEKSPTSIGSRYSGRRTPELEEEGASLASTSRPQSTKSTSSSDSSFEKNHEHEGDVLEDSTRSYKQRKIEHFITPSRRVKAVRLGRGTISIPLSTEQNFRRGSLRPSRHTNLSQQLWFDNDGQITRGLDLSDFETRLWNGAVILTPNRPVQSSIRVVPQVRSPYLILEEHLPDTRTVTVRVWDPRLHPYGPWITTRDEYDLTQDGIVVTNHMPKERVTWVRGLWVLHGQQPGSALCGTSLLTKQATPHPHAPHLHQVTLTFWNLLDHPTPSKKFYWSQYTPTSSSTPYLPSPSSSPVHDSFSDKASPSNIQKFSPLVLRWQRVMDLGTSVQEIALNEWVAAVRLVKRQEPPAPLVAGHAQQQAQGEQDLQPQQQAPRPAAARSIREEPHVHLFNTLTGGLFLDLTPDIPSSFFSGAGNFHLSLTRFHIVVYNSDLMAVFDLFKSRAHWIDVQIRSSHSQTDSSSSSAGTELRRMPRSSSTASIYSRSSSRVFQPHQLHPSHSNPQQGNNQHLLPHMRKIPVSNGLTSLTKLPYVGKPVRLDISDDECLLLLAPKCQRGEVSIVDLKRGMCRTYLLQDGYAEGAHARNGSLAGRSGVGIWIAYEEDREHVSGRRLLGGRLDSTLHVIWKSISV